MNLGIPQPRISRREDELLTIFETVCRSDFIHNQQQKEETGLNFVLKELQTRYDNQQFISTVYVKNDSINFF